MTEDEEKDEALHRLIQWTLQGTETNIHIWNEEGSTYCQMSTRLEPAYAELSDSVEAEGMSFQGLVELAVGVRLLTQLGPKDTEERREWERQLLEQVRRFCTLPRQVRSMGPHIETEGGFKISFN